METMQPTDVFGPRRLKQILVKDNGFDVCWVWLGEMNPDLRRLAWKYIELDNPHVPNLNVICGTEDCIHPDHIYAQSTEVGRMVYIRDHSHDEGECRIWDGYVDSRTNAPVIRGLSGNTANSLHVRRFIYNQEHGITAYIGPVDTSCGKSLCVSHRHLKPASDRRGKDNQYEW